MFVKIGALSFLVLISVVGFTTAGICPFDPLTPNEVSIGSLSGSVANGGSVNGTIFLSSGSVEGVNGEITGYISETRDLLGKGTILYADTSALNGFTGETGVSLDSGALSYSESAMYSFATPDPNCSETSTYTPFCVDALSDTKIYMNTGEYASTVNLLGTSTLLNHNSAMAGDGSYQASSAFKFMEGCNGTVQKYSQSSDKVTLIGDITFGRQVNFKLTH
jgi:hypothetical protein